MTEVGTDPRLPHIVIFGSRTFTDFGLLKEKMDKYTIDLGELVVVTGEWRNPGYGTPNYIGADLLGEQWAFGVHHYRKYRIPVVRFPPQWEKHPDSQEGRRRALLERNTAMAEFISGLKNGLGVGFWDGSSTGTAHMIAQLKKVKVEHRVVRYVEKR